MDKNTVQEVEQLKNEIMKELFVDVSDKECVLDMCLSKNSNVSLKQFCKKTRLFLSQNRKELLEEFNSGRILFFRKYNYEKILNKYLQQKYDVDKLEMKDFPSEQRKQELKKIEKENIERKKQSEIMQMIIQNASKYKWEKNEVKFCKVYMAVDSNGKTIKVIKNKKLLDIAVEYDGQELQYTYGNKKLLDIIEKNIPKEKRVVVIVNKNNIEESRRVQEEKKRKQEEKARIKEIELARQYLNKIKKERNALWNQKIDLFADGYKIPRKTMKNLVEEIENKCEYQRDETCNWAKSICIPLDGKCVYFRTLKYKILEEVKKNRVENETQRKLQYQNITQKDSKLKQNTNTKIEVHNIGFKDFLVRSNVFRCMNQKHNIKNIVASVNIDDNGKKINAKVSAGYCQNCNVYFIMESTYRSLKNKGIILCRISDEKSYMKSGYMNGAHLAQESILMQYGYNVSETQGLSALRRQKILAVMIDNKILAKSEIISYLNFFIRQRHNMSKMTGAISKWEADREFVEYYRIGEYTQYGVNAIYRK